MRKFLGLLITVALVAGGGLFLVGYYLPMRQMHLIITQVEKEGAYEMSHGQIMPSYEWLGGSISDIEIERLPNDADPGGREVYTIATLEYELNPLWLVLHAKDLYEGKQVSNFVRIDALDLTYVSGPVNKDASDFYSSHVTAQAVTLARIDFVEIEKLTSSAMEATNLNIAERFAPLLGAGLADDETLSGLIQSYSTFAAALAPVARHPATIGNITIDEFKMDNLSGDHIRMERLSITEIDLSEFAQMASLTSYSMAYPIDELELKGLSYSLDGENDLASLDRFYLSQDKVGVLKSGVKIPEKMTFEMAGLDLSPELFMGSPEAEAFLSANDLNGLTMGLSSTSVIDTTTGVTSSDLSFQLNDLFTYTLDATITGMDEPFLDDMVTVMMGATQTQAITANNGDAGQAMQRQMAEMEEMLELYKRLGLQHFQTQYIDQSLIDSVLNMMTTNDGEKAAYREAYAGAALGLAEELSGSRFVTELANASAQLALHSGTLTIETKLEEPVSFEALAETAMGDDPMQILDDMALSARHEKPDE